MTWLALGLLACHGERHHDRPEGSATDSGTADTDPCIDADGDGYSVTTVACDHGGDCDDSSETTYPGAPDETRDGVDQDCDARDGPRVEATGAHDIQVEADSWSWLPYPALVSSDLSGSPILVVPAYQGWVGSEWSFQEWGWGAEGWESEDPVVVATASEDDLDYNAYNNVLPVRPESGGGFIASFRTSPVASQLGKVLWVDGEAAGTVELTGDDVPTWTGTVEGGLFGYRLAFVGNVGGDGAPYFAVNWIPSPGGVTTSTLVLRLDGEGGDADDALTSLDPRPGLQFTVGDAIGGPIDFDGDGIDDVVTGSRFDSPDGAGGARGVVSVVPGPLPAGAFYVDDLDQRWGGTGLYSQLGRLFATPGDLDNDGLDDLLISADDCGLNDNGTLYALRKHTWILPGGSPEGTIDDVAPAVFAEADDPDIYTDPLYPAGLGDLDGDGHLDVGLGSDNVHDPTFSSYHDSGVVWIASGPFSGTVDLAQGPSMLAIWGAEEEDLNWVSGGDVNGDGLSDVVLSSNDPNAMGTNSAIYTFLSPF